MAEPIEAYLAAQPAVVRTIVVEIRADGYVSLCEGDRTTGELGVDEALFAFAELTHPKLGACRFMKTRTAHAAWRLHFGTPHPNFLKDGEGLLPAPSAPTNHRIERIDTRAVHKRLSPADSDWMNDPAALF